MILKLVHQRALRSKAPKWEGSGERGRLSVHWEGKDKTGFLLLGSLVQCDSTFMEDL